MVMTQTGLDTTESFTLDYFDNFLYLALGSGANSFSPGQTELINEQFRGLVESATKDAVAGTYIYIVELALSDANGYTLQEIGLFDQATVGNMATRNKLPISVEKTSDFKLRFTFQITVSASNA